MHTNDVKKINVCKLCKKTNIQPTYDRDICDCINIYRHIIKNIAGGFFKEIKRLMVTYLFLF